MPSIDEIKKALTYLKSNWTKQNDLLDSQTKFIYTTDSLDEVIKLCEAGNIDLNYALHRWYNFNCAKFHEQFFIDFGAVKERDKYCKTVDFYLFDIPFDLKTTYFPKAITNPKDYDLNSRMGKNNLIQWFYDNQSRQGRFHLENRLFVVCEDLHSKSDFDLIKERIKNFIEYSRLNGLNQIKLADKNIYSDIIAIQKKS